MADPLSEVYLGRANTGAAVVFPQSRETAADYYLRSRDMERRQKALVDAAAARAGKSDLSKPEDVKPDEFKGLLEGDTKLSMDDYNNVYNAGKNLLMGGLNPQQYAEEKIKVGQLKGKALANAEMRKRKAEAWTTQYKDFVSHPLVYDADAADKFAKINKGELDISALPKPSDDLAITKSLNELATKGVKYPTTVIKVPDANGNSHETTVNYYDEDTAKTAFNGWFSTTNPHAVKLTEKLTEAVQDPNAKEYNPLFAHMDDEQKAKTIHDMAYSFFAPMAEGVAPKLRKDQITQYHGGNNLVIGMNGAAGSNGLFNTSVDGDTKEINIAPITGSKKAEWSAYDYDGKIKRQTGSMYVKLDPVNEVGYVHILAHPAPISLSNEAKKTNTLPPGTEYKDNTLFVKDHVSKVPFSILIPELEANTLNKKGQSVFDTFEGGKELRDKYVSSSGTQGVKTIKAKKGKASETTLKFFQNATK